MGLGFRVSVRVFYGTFKIRESNKPEYVLIDGVFPGFKEPPHHQPQALNPYTFHLESFEIWG